MTITAAGIAVVILGVLLFRGQAGRVGIILAAIMGTALSIAGDLRGLLVGIAGTVTDVANSIGGSL